jgi:hypothetical protein
MSASDYVKSDVINFGEAVGDLVVAITGDGVGTEDLVQLIAAVTTGAEVVNEVKDVPAAAGLHILGAAGDTYGDYLLEKALEAEAAAGDG